MVRFGKIGVTNLQVFSPAPEKALVNRPGKNPGGSSKSFPLLGRCRMLHVSLSGVNQLRGLPSPLASQRETWNLRPAAEVVAQYLFERTPFVD